MRQLSRRSIARRLLGITVYAVAMQIVIIPMIGVPAISADTDIPCLSPADVLREPKVAAVQPLILKQICYKGYSKEKLEQVYLDRPDLQPHPNPQATVNSGEGFPSGTLFTAPSETSFDLVSERSVTHLFPGSQNLKYAADQSEVNNVRFGKVGFLVSAASKAFRTVSNTLLNPTVGVIADNIYCLSRDTAFTVDVVPQRSVSVAVTDGVVDITRAISIRLVAEGIVINGIRDFSSVATGQTATFDVSAPPQDFPNANEAQTYYTAQLQAALERDDRPRIEDITFNLRQLQDVKPVAAPTVPRATHTSALRNIAAALVPILIFTIPNLVIHNPTVRLTPQPPGVPVPGTVVIQGNAPQKPPRP